MFGMEEVGETGGVIIAGGIEVFFRGIEVARSFDALSSDGVFSDGVTSCLDDGRFLM